MRKYEENDQQQCGHNFRIIPGVLLVLLGLILILNNLGKLPQDIKPFIFSWQMLLIVIGIFVSAKRDSRLAGIILIVIGLFFIVADYYYFPFNLRRLFWPIVLIAFGLLLIFRQFVFRKYCSIRSEKIEGTDYINESAVFGGSENRVVSKQFKGGRLTCIFGGSEIDLTGSDIVDNPIVLDIFFLFGGAELLIPSEWKVKLEVNSIFGGFSDKRRKVAPEQIAEDKVIIIKGMAIFGGGEIKSY